VPRSLFGSFWKIILDSGKKGEYLLDVKCMENRLKKKRGSLWKQGEKNEESV
jgi:hypothetical protein